MSFLLCLCPGKLYIVMVLGICMKKKVVFVVLIFCIYCLVLVSCGGDSSKADIDLGNSELFAQEELEAAAACVKKEFRIFGGCTMLNLRYDEEETKKAGNDWKKNFDQEGNIAIFVSDFETDSAGGDGSMEPNSTYPDWQWILLQDKRLKTWKILTSGY